MKISREALKRVQNGERLLITGISGDVISYYTKYREEEKWYSPFFRHETVCEHDFTVHLRPCPKNNLKGGIYHEQAV